MKRFSFFRKPKHTKRKSPTKRKATSASSGGKVILIDKFIIRECLRNIILDKAPHTGSQIGFVFDMDSLVSSGGQLVGAQSTILTPKGFTIVFYLDCIYVQFQKLQEGNISLTQENLDKLTTFLKKIVVDQIFAIESRPLPENVN
jgi:hypothetical protein